MQHFALDTFRFAYRLAPLKILMNHSYSPNPTFSKDLANHYSLPQIDALNFLSDLFQTPKFLYIFQHKLSITEKRTLQAIMRNLTVNKPAFLSLLPWLLQEELIYFEAYSQHVIKKYKNRKKGDLKQDFEVKERLDTTNPNEEEKISAISNQSQISEAKSSNQPDQENDSRSNTQSAEASEDNEAKNQTQYEASNEITRTESRDLEASGDQEGMTGNNAGIYSKTIASENGVQISNKVTESGENKPDQESNPTPEILPSYTSRHNQFIIPSNLAIQRGMASMYLRLLKFRLQMSDCTNQGYILLNLEKLLGKTDLSHFFYKHPLLSVYPDSLFNPFASFLYSYNINQEKSLFFNTPSANRDLPILNPLNFDIIVKAADFFSAQTDCKAMQYLKIPEFGHFLKFLIIPNEITRTVHKNMMPLEASAQVEDNQPQQDPQDASNTQSGSRTRSRTSEIKESTPIDDYETRSPINSPHLSTQSQTTPIDFIPAKIYQIANLLKSQCYFTQGLQTDSPKSNNISSADHPKGIEISHQDTHPNQNNPRNKSTLNINNPTANNSRFLNQNNKFEMERFLDFDFEETERQRIADLVLLESLLATNMEIVGILKEWGRMLENKRSETANTYFEEMLDLVVNGRKPDDQDNEQEIQENQDTPEDLEDSKISNTKVKFTLSINCKIHYKIIIFVIKILI